MKRSGRPAAAWTRRQAITSTETPSHRLPELELYRLAWENSQHPHAVQEALRVCREDRVPPPSWLVRANLQMTQLGFEGKLPRRLREHHHDVIDYARWDFLEECRSHGLTWERAADLATRYFRGTSASCGPAGMVASWKKVRKTDRRRAIRYYLTPSDHRWNQDCFTPPTPRWLEILPLFPEAR